MTGTSESGYRMVWSWPYQLIAPVLLAWGVAFPFLIRDVESRRLEGSDWIVTCALVVAGVVLAACLRTRIEVDRQGIVRTTMFRRQELLWPDIQRVVLRHRRVLLFGNQGMRLRVEFAMTNDRRFARDLERRFTAAGTPRMDDSDPAAV